MQSIFSGEWGVDVKEDHFLLKIDIEERLKSYKEKLTEPDPNKKLKLFAGKNKFSRTPLMYSTYFDLKSFKDILYSFNEKQRVALLCVNDDRGYATLTYAIKVSEALDKNPEIVKAILDSVSINKRNKLLNSKDNWGRTPLMHSIFCSSELVNILLDSIEEKQKLALFRAKDNKGASVLTLLVKGSHNGSLEALLTQATSIKFRDRMRIFTRPISIIPCGTSIFEWLISMESPTIQAFQALHGENEHIANIIIEVAKLQNITEERVIENSCTLNIILQNLESKNKALFNLVECIAIGKRPIISGDERIDNLFVNAKSFIEPVYSPDLIKVSISIANINNCSSKLKPEICAAAGRV
jgi:ankyrin repeat protein